MNPRIFPQRFVYPAPAALALLILWLPFSACSGAGPENPGGGDAGQLRRRLAELNRREQVLTAEYALARTPAPYIIVDLQSGDIDLRARGRDLRKFRLGDARHIKGGDSADPIWKMTEKKPLEQSERPQITPGSGEDAAAEAAKQSLWGPHRMPSDYDLICEEDRVLEIRALPSSESGPRVWQRMKTAYRRTLDQVRAWQAAKTDQARERLQLWLSEEEARLPFWSLPKKINLLVLE